MILLEVSVNVKRMSSEGLVTDVLLDSMDLVPRDANPVIVIISGPWTTSVTSTQVSVDAGTILTADNVMNASLDFGIIPTAKDVVVMVTLMSVTPRLEFVLDAKITRRELLVKSVREDSTAILWLTTTSPADPVHVQESLDQGHLMQILVNSIPRLRIPFVDVFQDTLARDVIAVTTTSGEVLLLLEDPVNPVSVTTTSMSLKQETVMQEPETVSGVSTILMESIVRFVEEDSLEMQQNNSALSVFAMILEPILLKDQSVII